MAECGLAVDHSTIARWVLTYTPVLNGRIRPEMRHPGRSWRVDENLCAGRQEVGLLISGDRLSR